MGVIVYPQYSVKLRNLTAQLLCIALGKAARGKDRANALLFKLQHFKYRAYGFLLCLGYKAAGIYK